MDEASEDPRAGLGMDPYAKYQAANGPVVWAELVFSKIKDWTILVGSACKHCCATWDDMHMKRIQETLRLFAFNMCLFCGFFFLFCIEALPLIFHAIGAPPGQ